MHQHDGFMLRVATGAGYHISRFKLPTGDLRLQGFGFPTSLAIGYSVAEDWALQLDLWDSTDGVLHIGVVASILVCWSYPQGALVFARACMVRAR